MEGEPVMTPLAENFNRAVATAKRERARAEDAAAETAREKARADDALARVDDALARERELVPDVVALRFGPEGARCVRPVPEAVNEPDRVCDVRSRAPAGASAEDLPPRAAFEADVGQIVRGDGPLQAERPHRAVEGVAPDHLPVRHRGIGPMVSKSVPGGSPKALRSASQARVAHSEPGHAMRAMIKPTAAVRNDGAMPGRSGRSGNAGLSMARGPACPTPAGRGRGSSGESASTCWGSGLDPTAGKRCRCAGRAPPAPGECPVTGAAGLRGFRRCAGKASAGGLARHRGAAPGRAGCVAAPCCRCVRSARGGR